MGTLPPAIVGVLHGDAPEVPAPAPLPRIKCPYCDGDGSRRTRDPLSNCVAVAPCVACSGSGEVSVATAPTLSPETLATFFRNAEVLSGAYTEALAEIDRLKAEVKRLRALIPSEPEKRDPAPSSSAPSAPPWECVAMHDPACRRGVWYRATATTVEVRAGREGDDCYVSLAAGQTLDLGDVEALVGCLATGAMQCLDHGPAAEGPRETAVKRDPDPTVPGAPGERVERRG